MTERQDRGNEAAETGGESSVELVQQTEQRALAGELALELMHEMRDPLETLGYLTYLTAQEAKDAEKVLKYMRIAEEELARMTTIARQTLGLAKTATQATPVDLVELAETALRIHRRTIEGKRIQLNRKLPQALVVEAQHGPLLQVLSNLIVNAIEAMGEAGALSVRVRKRKDVVELLVADNGHGIAEEHLQRLGERYFTTKGDAGNGLGLTISKRIVEQHRGRLRVRSSTRPGRMGTVFKVSLPVGQTGGARERGSKAG